MARIGIDAKTWVRLSELLDEALERPPEARDAWLASLDRADEPLIPRLRDLLLHSRAIETNDFLHALPHIDIYERRPEAIPPGGAGEIVGSYRLVREIGTGGMGSVWLAERADGLFTRPVALKFPHLFGMQGALADRMAREREILATLDHPHIAKLFDAGIGAGGRPYLALEFVEGVPLDKYFEREPATSLQARLRLFLQVADAVSYAHGKLVIHRDLKPANILVDASGEARLLDFGIAKLIESGQGGTGQITEMSGRPFTPDYASPEQILGEPLGIASDIYSLGVVFHELLSGQRPYRLKRDSPGGLEAAILQCEPAPLPRALRGDLATIAQKALKKQPRERYATVNEFADDIVRYLDDRPVLARPDSRWYRLRKFTARNRVGVAAAALVTLVVVAGAGLALWQARVAIAERDRAEEVKTFITSIFQDADPYQSSDGQITGATLLTRARARIGEQFGTRPALRVELLTMVGSSLIGLGDLTSAESALRQATEDATRLAGPASLPTVRARVMLANVFNRRRDLARLELELATLLPLARAVASEDPKPLVQALMYSADLDIEQSDFAAAQRHSSEAFDLALRTLGPRDRLSVQASNLMAESRAFTADPVDEMLAATTRGVAFAQAALGENSDDQLLLYMRAVYGRSLMLAGRYHEAVEVQTKTVAALQAALGADNLDVLNAISELASSETSLGALRESLAHHRNILAALDRRIDTHSGDYTAELLGLGSTLIAARRPAEALPVFERIERLHRDMGGSENSRTLGPTIYRAWALARLGRFDAAQRLLALGNLPGARLPSAQWYAIVSGSVKRLQGDAAGATESLRKAMSLIKEGPRADWDRMRICGELGLALHAAGDRDAAEETLQRSLALTEKNRALPTPAQADVLLTLGRLRFERGRYADALPFIERADHFWSDFDAQNPGAGEAAYWLGRAQLELGQPARARETLRRASSILQTSMVPEHQRLAKAARVAIR